MAEAGAYSSYPTVTNRLLPPPDPMQSLGQVVGVAQGIQGLSQQQFDLAHKQLGATNQIFGAIATDPRPETVNAAAASLRNLGVPANVIATELGNVAGFINDPQKLKQWAFDHISRNMSVQEQLQGSGMGAPSLVNTGAQLAPTTIRSGLTPGVAPAQGGAIPLTMGPGEASAPVAGPPTATGAPTVISKGSFAERTGTAAPGTYTKPGQASGAPGGMVVGQAPGAAEAQGKTAVAGAEQGIGLQKMADGVPTRKAMFAQLENDLDHFASGPGADWQNVAKAWANRNVLPGSMQFDPKSIASQEQFNKQAVMVAQQQFQALGGTGTDSQLSSTMKTSPNAALSEMGNRGIIQLLKGNEDAISAKNQAWQQWKQQNGADTYDRFQTAFNKSYNPLVFQAQYMNPEEIQKLRQKLSPKDQEAFARSYAIAKANGWVGGGNAGQ